ncbi:MAG: hypothetical protein IT306_26720 [Chloroflexi bacterium]|nr:hypothetical protein [Chloroflexota bacterium]
MAVGRQGQAEARQPYDEAARARATRPGEQASRRTGPGGPAFISDQAEEQYHLDQLHDPQADPLTKASARIELARMYERRGQFAEAAEMYERNVWAGIRTPATYAGLAAAYRQIGRNDLADAALEQVRRQGGAVTPMAQAATVSPAYADTAPLPAAQPRQQRRDHRTSAVRQSAERIGSLQPRQVTARPTGQVASQPRATREERRSALGLDSLPQVDLMAQIRALTAPIMRNEIGRRTVVASSVLIPIAIGVAIFAVVVMTSTRSRAAEPPATASAPAPAATAPAPPAAEAQPTQAPAVLAALTEPPDAARLVIQNTGPGGLTLRRSPGVGERIRILNDGTEVADLGDTAEHSGRSWKKVRDPQGSVGWAAAEFLTAPGAATDAAPMSSAAGAAPRPQAGPPFASGGLGLSRAEWEVAHGQPTRSSIFLEYAGGRLVVGLLEGNVWHLERVWQRNDATPLDAARNDARVYVPSDAVLVQSLDRGDGRIIDVYSSAILTGRFGQTAWNGGRPGTFTIQYRFRTPADRMVISAMFRLGDLLS